MWLGIGRLLQSEIRPRPGCTVWPLRHLMRYRAGILPLLKSTLGKTLDRSPVKAMPRKS